ncbi:MAG TPA: hypothetical protein VFI96_03025 [Longimicrobiaceae bacterium]|nr:hypothetical protein [Longimicrobiaceae bacterium]
MLTLHRLSFSYRLLYTAVLVFMTAGTAVHTLHQEVRAGLAPAEVAAWYRGNADDPEAVEFLFPKSFEEVWGDVWLALTTYTLALLVFGGVLMRSDAAPRVRATLVGGYAACALAAAAAPLLVRYAAAEFAWMETVALLALPLLAIAMTAVAVRDMWLRRAAGPRVDTSREL